MRKFTNWVTKHPIWACLFVFFVPFAMAAGFERLPQPLIKMGRGLAESIQILFENDANETLTVANTGDAALTSDAFTLGDGTATDKSFTFDRGGNNPGFLWDESDAKLKFTKDGTKFTEVGTGSGGGSGVNFLLPDNNPGFEDDTDTWVPSTPGHLTLETVNPLFQLQSGIWDPTAASDTLETADIAVPIEYKGRSCSAAFSYLWDAGTTGQITALVQTDGGDDLTLPVDVESTLGVTKQVFLAFICPTGSDLIKITLTATANAQPITLDSFHLGSNIFAGQTDVFRGWKVYDESVVSITSPLGSFAVQDGEFIPYQTADRQWRLRFNFSCTHVTVTGGTSRGFTIVGAQAKGSGQRYAVNTSSQNGGVERQEAEAVGSDTLIVVVSPNSSSLVRISGDIPLEGKPTWADDNQLPQETVTLETQGWYIDADVGGQTVTLSTTDVSTYTLFGNGGLDVILQTGSAPANIACDNAPSTGSTCSGTEQVGISFTAPYAGSYQVCGETQPDIFVGDAGNDAIFNHFKIVKRSNSDNTILEEASQVYSYGLQSIDASDITARGTVRPCGIFKLSAGQHTFSIAYTVDTVGTPTTNRLLIDRGTGQNGSRTSYFTVIPLTQQFPQAVALPTTRYERKFLVGNVTTNTTFLQFTGLTIGKTYEYDVKACYRVNDGAVASQIRLEIFHNASAINLFDAVMRGGGTNNERGCFGGSDIFVATATTLDFNSASASANAYFVGNSNATYAILKELGHHTPTTDF